MHNTVNISGHIGTNKETVKRAMSLKIYLKKKDEKKFVKLI